jgi:hypothetical protein
LAEQRVNFKYGAPLLRLADKQPDYAADLQNRSKGASGARRTHEESDEREEEGDLAIKIEPLTACEYAIHIATYLKLETSNCRRSL